MEILNNLKNIPDSKKLDLIISYLLSQGSPNEPTRIQGQSALYQYVCYGKTFGVNMDLGLDIRWTYEEQVVWDYAIVADRIFCHIVSSLEIPMETVRVTMELEHQGNKQGINGIPLFMEACSMRIGRASEFTSSEEKQDRYFEDLYVKYHAHNHIVVRIEQKKVEFSFSEFEVEGKVELTEEIKDKLKKVFGRTK